MERQRQRKRKDKDKFIKTKRELLEPETRDFKTKGLNQELNK